MFQNWHSLYDPRPEMTSKRLKILILEDDEILKMGLEEVLLEKGFEITKAASNSEEAIASFKSDRPDIAILDIHLERSLLDGIQTGMILNELGRVPIIFLTGLADEAIRERAKGVRPAYYLIKPCSPTQLEVAIDMALENHYMQRDASIHHSLKAHAIQEESIYPISDAFFLKNKGKYIRIYVDQILWIEAANSSVIIESDIGKFVFSANLKSFHNQFNHPSLIKIHRSYLVNKEKVSAFDDSSVQIMHQSRLINLPIGQSYKDDINQAFIRLRTGF